MIVGILARVGRWLTIWKLSKISDGTHVSPGIRIFGSRAFKERIAMTIEEIRKMDPGLLVDDIHPPLVLGFHPTEAMQSLRGRFTLLNESAMSQGVENLSALVVLLLLSVRHSKNGKHTKFKDLVGETEEWLTKHGLEPNAIWSMYQEDRGSQ